jgi:hypothetical protein
MIPTGVELFAFDFSRRNKFNASRRNVARFSAACPARARLWSSRKHTSNTQCSLFSTPQCPRTARANVSTATGRLDK